MRPAMIQNRLTSVLHGTADSACGVAEDVIAIAVENDDFIPASGVALSTFVIENNGEVSFFATLLVIVTLGHRWLKVFMISAVEDTHHPLDIRRRSSFHFHSRWCVLPPPIHPAFPKIDCR